MAKEKVITNDIADEEFWSDQIKEKENKNSLTVEDASGEESEWLDENYDGQLSVDVYQTERDVIIKSTIAGVKPEDIDISFNNDMITIRGVREQQEEINKEDYFYQECYWGGFSRSIILPVEVKSDKAEAVLENGILIITLPKAIRAKSTTIRVKEKK